MSFPVPLSFSAVARLFHCNSDSLSFVDRQLDNLSTIYPSLWHDFLPPTTLTD